MKITIKTVLGLITPLFLTVGCTNNMTFHEDPFISRNGSTVEVKVNGIATKRTKHKSFIDEDGVKAAEADWQSESNGSLCFDVVPKNPELGELIEVQLTITEYRADRPYTRWKKYLALPRVEEQIIEGEDKNLENYCPQEFQLTPRLKFTSLPVGTYHVAVRVAGTENWDKQEIELIIR